MKLITSEIVLLFYTRPVSPRPYSGRGLMVGGIYNYLTIKNKHMNLSFLVKVLVQKFVLVRFVVQESHSQSSSHDFILFDTQYLPCISTLSSYLSSNLRPETTHTSN